LKTPVSSYVMTHRLHRTGRQLEGREPSSAKYRKDEIRVIRSSTFSFCRST